MGYACPVCEDPQADAEHLANHLAFTAMTGGADHESWLDERVPDWGQHGEAELADAVVEYAEEEEFPQVFEESGVADHDHAVDPQAARERGAGALDDEAEEVLAEARALTEEMQDEADGDETQ